MTRAEAAPANDGNLRDHAVSDGIDHFCAGADNAAPLRVFAHHETVHVVQEHQRDPVLVAIQNKAGCLFCRLGVNYASKFDALLIRAAGQRLYMFFLIRNDAHSPSLDPRIAAEQRFPVFRAIFLEFARIHDACDDFAHVILFGRVAGKDSVDFVRGKKRLPRLGMAEGRGSGCAHLVYQRANAVETRLIIRFAKIHRAADLRVHLRAAQFFCGRLLSNGRLHERGPGQE